MPVIDLGSVVGPAGPQGVAGQTGATGATGPAGPNQVTGSTSTPLNGILQGNGSVVQAVQSDAAPTAGSNNIVRSGVVYDGLQRKVNHNFLLNWYFVGGGSSPDTFPINMRGQSTYNENASGITIDGWYKINNASVGLQADCITLSHASGTSTQLRQYLGEKYTLAGRTLTFSVLAKGDNGTALSLGFNDGRGQSGGETYELTSTPSVYTYTFTTQNPISSTLQLIVYVACPNSSSKVYLYASKLEFGTAQTLARQENGVFVLNDVPIMMDERMRVQTQYNPGTDYSNHVFAFGDMLGPVEYGNAASQAYSTGKIFVWRGYLYKAKTSISSGATFTEGTNCEKTTIAALMNL